MQKTRTQNGQALVELASTSRLPILALMRVPALIVSQLLNSDIGRTAAEPPLRHPAAPHPRPRPHGQAMTEFSLALPLLGLILMGCLDLGRAFHVHMAAANAAHVGLMYAQQATDPTTSASITVSDVIARTVAAAQGSLDTSQMQVDVCLQNVPTCPIMDTSQAVDSDEPETITVSVTVPFTTITPFVHLTTVGGSASGRSIP